MTGTRDGNITETGIEQIRVNACVSIDEDALCCEALGTVAGDGVTVVEVVVRAGIELDLAVVVETG